MDKSQLYKNSSIELTNARNCQLLISQKELELQLTEIQGRSDYLSTNNSFSSRLKLTAIKNEIGGLLSQRDSHTNNSIDIALDIIIYELEENTTGVFSIGSLAIGAINSFISSYKIDFRLSISNSLKLSRVSSNLLFADIGYMTVRNKVNELKRLTRTY